MNRSKLKFTLAGMAIFCGFSAAVAFSVGWISGLKEPYPGEVEAVRKKDTFVSGRVASAPIATDSSSVAKNLVTSSAGPKAAPKTGNVSLRPPQLNSYAKEDQYPVTAWSPNQVFAGHVDAFTFAGVALTRELSTQMVDSDVLTVSGWAGDGTLGMRVPSVVFTACGMVVGSAPVDAQRGDVARAVHPNLARSGWSARLLVGHLPRCENMVLKGYAVAPAGQALFALAGELRLDLPARAGGAEGPEFAGSAQLHPRDIPRMLPLVRLTVVSARVNVRHCAGTKCKIVGTLGNGTTNGAVLDETGGWLLGTFGEVAGWVSRRVVRIERLPPQKPKPARSVSN